MQTVQRPAHITSKFIALYSKLLQGVSPSRLDPNGNSEQLYADLLDLEVDSVFLLGELQKISKDDCLGKHKVRLASRALEEVSAQLSATKSRSSAPCLVNAYGMPRLAATLTREKTTRWKR